MRVVTGSMAIAMTVVLAGCQSSTSSAPKPTVAQPAPARVETSTVATPTATPAAPALVVEKTGASVSPAGYLAFALIDNLSTKVATEVTVELEAKDASGNVLSRKSRRIARIGPMEKQAAGVEMPARRSLPASFQASIKSVQWRDADSQGDQLAIAQTAFLPTPKLPSVRIRVLNNGTSRRVAITTVCFDSAGQLRGGGLRSLMLGQAPAGIDVVIDVAIPVTPSACESYAAPAP